MNLPSKELLSAVFGFNAIPESVIDNTLWYDYEDNMTEIINIYELAHKCKEWARSNGYLLYSVPDLCIVKTLNLEYCVDFGLSTEVESIFRACQWILDDKEQK